VLPEIVRQGLQRGWLGGVAALAVIQALADQARPLKGGWAPRLPFRLIGGASCAARPDVAYPHLAAPIERYVRCAAACDGATCERACARLLRTEILAAMGSRDDPDVEGP
jgi:hypothetical protein